MFPKYVIVLDGDAFLTPFLSFFIVLRFPVLPDLREIIAPEVLALGLDDLNLLYFECAWVNVHLCLHVFEYVLVVLH